MMTRFHGTYNLVFTKFQASSYDLRSQGTETQNCFPWKLKFYGLVLSCH